MLRTPSIATALLALTTGLAQTVATEKPANDQTHAVAWMQRSAEYRAACLQTFRIARQSLELNIGDPNQSACIEQLERGGFLQLPPAIIVDVDETVLDNTVYNARLILSGTEWKPSSWAAWVRERKATALPGALNYVQAATQMGARVVYITDRLCDSGKEGELSTEETDTRANLHLLGFPIQEDEGEDVVLTKGEIGDKSARRAEVAKRYRIVQIVGDNLADFAPGVRPQKVEHSQMAAECAATERVRNTLTTALADWWGQRWILLPNPAYGSFVDVLTGQHGTLRDALRAK